MRQRIQDLFINWREWFPATIFVSLAIFTVSGLAGYSTGASESKSVMEELMNTLAPLKRLNHLFLAALIFFNNSIKAVFTILAGLLLGLGPLVFLTLNGFLLGIVIKGVVLEHGAIMTILGLLPHGILEIPSIILSSAMGLHLGIVVFKKIAGRDIQVKKEIKQCLIFYVAIILPALLVAAFVEVFVTPALAGAFR